MKSIREAAALVQILNLIQNRSYDILCDKWGIKVNIAEGYTIEW